MSALRLINLIHNTVIYHQSTCFLNEIDDQVEDLMEEVLIDTNSGDPELPPFQSHITTDSTPINQTAHQHEAPKVSNVYIIPSVGAIQNETQKQSKLSNSKKRKKMDKPSENNAVLAYFVHQLLVSLVVDCLHLCSIVMLFSTGCSYLYLL